jgi:hypothetical protein
MIAPRLTLPLLLGATLAAQAPTHPTRRPAPLPPAAGDVVKAPRAAVAKPQAPALPAAAPASPPAPERTEAPGAAALRPLVLPEHVLHDVDADGALWARGHTWKARFDGRSCTFVPFLGSEVPHNQPLDLRLAQATVAGQPLPLAAERPVRAGDRITVDHGGCRETFDVRPDGVEQSWVFDRLPVRGELRVVLAASGPLRGEDLGAELAFRGPHGGVHYGGAVAIDARGQRLPLALDLHGDTVSVTVPASFVATAALPLVVDPFLSTIGLAYVGNFVGNPDLAFDYTTQEFLVVWQHAYSATDHDVWAQRLDLAQAPVGPPFTLDFTSVSWSKPRVANQSQFDQFLLVAECSNAFTSPRWIGGRLWNATSGAGPQFDVERAGNPGSYSGDALNPDVGGDPYELGTSYFTVVWQREFSAADHDILSRQVTGAGALRGTTPTAIDTSTTFQAKPRIGKSLGYSLTNPTPLQRWAIVYEEHYSATDVDVRGTQMTWDGQLPAAGPNHPITLSTSDDRTPVVSTPTDDATGTFCHLVAWASRNGGDSDIAVAVWDQTLTVRATADLQTLETAGPAQAWPQFAPAVDSDGVRFVVTYAEAFGGGSDIDVRASVVAFEAGSATLGVHEARTAIMASTNFEGTPAIASAWSGGGSSVHYGIALQDRDAVGTHGIHAAVFLGHSNTLPLPSLRSTGCGGLGISWADIPAPGRVVSFFQTDSGPLTGFVFGFPASVPIGPCLGCTLGVNGVTVPNPFAIVIPPDVTFVGVSFAAQAWSFAAGPCLGAIALSDTVDFTVL